MNYIVYKTTNIVNGKIYIGVHKTEDPNIFDGYLGCGVYTYTKKFKRKGFPQAVKKYGAKSFRREVLFIFPFTDKGKLEAYKKEAELVTNEFINNPNVYNLTTGGRFTAYENKNKKIAQYTLDGQFIRTWNSILEASRELNLTSIKQCLSGKSKYCGNYQWRYYINKNNITPVTKIEKTVYQFDLSGNLIKVWKSSVEASSIFKNQNAARVAISNVCNNICRQAYGYYWSHKKIFSYAKYKQERPVARYTDDGKFIESYTSIKEAAEAMKLKTSGNIISAIQGKQKRCAGFRWRYFYGNTSNIKPL